MSTMALNQYIFTLAKGLANGVPVGAMLAKSSLGEPFSYGILALPLEAISWLWQLSHA